LKRSLIGVAITATLVVGFTANAWAASPPIGIYQGIVNGTSQSPPVCGTVHNEGEGYFRVKRNQSGVKRIFPVGSSNYCGGLSIPKIQAPSDPVNNCNSMNASLTVASIPLPQGAFDYSGTAPFGAGGTNRDIKFKGAWDPSINRFKGFTRITGGSGTGCGAKKYWRMKKVA